MEAISHFTNYIITTHMHGEVPEFNKLITTEVDAATS
jgi:hypothetical protein